MNQIDTTPANYASIETSISNKTHGEITSTFMETQGSSAKGLSALEYLIFQPDSLERILRDSNRLDSVLAITNDLKRVSNELLVEWLPDNGGFGGPTCSSIEHKEG